MKKPRLDQFFLDRTYGALKCAGVGDSLYYFHTFQRHALEKNAFARFDRVWQMTELTPPVFNQRLATGQMKPIPTPA